MQFYNKCNSINSLSSDRNILLDDIGRTTMKLYFKKYQKVPDLDVKILSIIEIYQEMCRNKREKGED